MFCTYSTNCALSLARRNRETVGLSSLRAPLAPLSHPPGTLISGPRALEKGQLAKKLAQKVMATYHFYAFQLLAARGIVFTGRPSVRCPLTAISRYCISPFLVEGFRRNLAEIIIV